MVKIKAQTIFKFIQQPDYQLNETIMARFKSILI